MRSIQDISGLLASSSMTFLPTYRITQVPDCHGNEKGHMLTNTNTILMDALTSGLTAKRAD